MSAIVAAICISHVASYVMQAHMCASSIYTFKYFHLIVRDNINAIGRQSIVVAQRKPHASAFPFVARTTAEACTMTVPAR